MAYLCTLRQRMRDREFSHVILLHLQANEVIVNPRLVLACIVEVELLRLHVVLAQFLVLELGDLLEEALFLFHAHAPDDHDAVLEKEDFRDMHGGVEVGSLGSVEVRLGFRADEGVVCGLLRCT